MFDVNVFGLLEVTQAFAPQIIAAKGQIINIGSLAGVIPVPYQGLYNASKAAIHSLSDTLRVEMAPFGVKVICVSLRPVSLLTTPKSTFGRSRIETDPCVVFSRVHVGCYRRCENQLLPQHPSVPFPRRFPL